MAADLVSIMRGVPEESIEINLITRDQFARGDAEIGHRALLQATSSPADERAPEE